MTQYTNSGILFKNDYKEKDSHPDYKGSFTDAEGNEWDLSAWIKDGRKGKFMTLSASEPYQQSPGDNNQSPPQNNTPPESFDDQIPF